MVLKRLPSDPEDDGDEEGMQAHKCVMDEDGAPSSANASGSLSVSRTGVPLRANRFWTNVHICDFVTVTGCRSAGRCVFVHRLQIVGRCQFNSCYRKIAWRGLEHR